MVPSMRAFVISDLLGILVPNPRRPIHPISTTRDPKCSTNHACIAVSVSG